jgi:hypothetical protein
MGLRARDVEAKDVAVEDNRPIEISRSQELAHWSDDREFARSTIFHGLAPVRIVFPLSPHLEG